MIHEIQVIPLEGQDSETRSAVAASVIAMVRRVKSRLSRMSST